MSLTPQSSEPRERIVGFDLLRTWVFFVILCWHAAYMYFPWGLGGAPDELPGPLAEVLEWLLYRTSYSGFILVFLTSFLLGMKRTVFAGRWWLPVIMLTGWAMLSLVVSVYEDEPFRLWWDVYPLLLVGFISGDGLLRIPGRATPSALLLLSLAILAVPVWQWQDRLGLPVYWTEVLVGRCPDDPSMWPVFPWIGLVWAGLAGGRLLRQLRVSRPREWFALRRWEYPILAAALLIFLVVVRVYMGTPRESEWACFIFRQSPLVFAGLLFAVATLMRVFLAPAVNDTLSSWRPTRWISEMAINRQFFLAYLTHYVILATTGYVMNWSGTATSLQLHAGWFATLALTEMVPRTFMILRARREYDRTVEADPDEAPDDANEG